jgi:hypothetical protein
MKTTVSVRKTGDTFFSFPITLFPQTSPISRIPAEFFNHSDPRRLCKLATASDVERGANTSLPVLSCGGESPDEPQTVWKAST